MSLRILSAANIRQVTSSFSTSDLLRQSAVIFSLLSSSTKAANDNAEAISSPHRTSIQTANHTVLFMPSRVKDTGTTIKVVSVPMMDKVKDGGLPASTMVIDEETGGTKALVNARSLTAVRTAGGSLLSSVLVLGGAKPTHLTAFGAGAQISAHISLHLRLFPSIRTVNIVNRSVNARLASLMSTLKADFPVVTFLSITGGDPSATQEAVKSANIIVTATSSTAPLFASDWVQPGTHIILVGSYKPSMHEVSTELIRRAGRVIVDSRSACLQEAGELIDTQATEEKLVELGELVSVAQDNSGEWTAKRDVVNAVRATGDVTIFKSVGVGVQDVMITTAVVSRAEELGIGTIVDDYD